MIQGYYPNKASKYFDPPKPRHLALCVSLTLRYTKKWWGKKRTPKPIVMAVTLRYNS